MPHAWIRALILRNRFRALFAPHPFRIVLPYTLLSPHRLRNLYQLATKLDREGVMGDIVECGVFNGGSGALLAHATSSSPHQRHVWLLDSFQGLPSGKTEDGRNAQKYVGECRGNESTVLKLLGDVGVPLNSVTIVAGWYSETVPIIAVSEIALLHIDCDFYESVSIVFDHLFPRVSNGGFVVVDDFGSWAGCRLACEEYFARNSLNPRLISIDRHAVFFQK